tara:strand:- start:659 stop:829 length:171 start_codon:yes stop_codon:yes gene_type:complete
MIKYQMIIGLQEPRQLIIWSLLVVEVEQLMLVVEVELEVIELLVMAQVLYKDQQKI